jgi:hypothetical protein
VVQEVRQRLALMVLRGLQILAVAAVVLATAHLVVAAVQES